mgnify:CR=1 FL=1
MSLRQKEILGAGRRRYYQFAKIRCRTRIGRPSLQNKAKEKTSVELDKKNPNHAILLVGKDDFPLPIPIVKQKGSGSLIRR